jgi:predicted phosphodiesterase
MKGGDLIGIMADSHGKSETIEAAIELLKNRKCDRIYHLGDVCDSAHPETAHTCVHPLQINNVVTIKGNNDQGTHA